MAQMKGGIPKQIKVSYEHDPEYRLIAANGVYGGITPRGDLKFDFFVEQSTIPKSVELRISQDGKVREEKDATPRLTRRVQMGVLLSPDHVESFAIWFRQKADEIRKMREKADDHSQPE